MTTAGNLVFQGTSVGLFKAFAADSGEELLSMDMQSGIVAAPSTYMIDGEQYVAFLTSKGGAFPLVAGVAGGASRMVPNIPRLVVMKLGGKTALPALPEKGVKSSGIHRSQLEHRNRLPRAKHSMVASVWSVMAIALSAMASRLICVSRALWAARKPGLLLSLAAH